MGRVVMRRASHPRSPRWTARALLAAALLLAPGCGGKPDHAGAPSILVGNELPPADGPRVTLSITPADDANGALPFYMMARSVQEQTYLVEPYQAVAARVMQPDDTVVKTWVMHPGRAQVINLQVPPKGRLAVYALFSDATGNWRTLLPLQPPGHVRLRVSAMQLSSLDRQE